MRRIHCFLFFLARKRDKRRTPSRFASLRGTPWSPPAEKRGLFVAQRLGGREGPKEEIHAVKCSVAFGGAVGKRAQRMEIFRVDFFIAFPQHFCAPTRGKEVSGCAVI